MGLLKEIGKIGNKIIQNTPLHYTDKLMGNSSASLMNKLETMEGDGGFTKTLSAIKKQQEEQAEKTKQNELLRSRQMASLYNGLGVSSFNNGQQNSNFSPFKTLLGQ
jgi:hypothetical protein